MWGIGSNALGDITREMDCIDNVHLKAADLGIEFTKANYNQGEKTGNSEL
jgi:hypothetical protein